MPAPRDRARSAPATPPLMHQLIDDLHELRDGAAFLHDIAGRRVEWHDAVADAPAPLAFRVQPDDALHPLANLTDGPGLRVVVVVPGITQDEHGGLPIERVELGLGEAAERVPEVGAAMIVHGGRLERPVDRTVHRVRVEGLRDLRDLGHEHVGAHAREALLQAPHELEHEARGIPYRVRYVAERDELRLLPMPTAKA